MILLDTMLNGKSGAEICKKIKSDPVNRHIPIILVSATTNLPRLVRECNADGYLQKPFEIEELVRTIQKYLPEDRKSTGLVQAMSIRSNSTLASLKQFGKIWLRPRRETAA